MIQIIKNIIVTIPNDVNDKINHKIQDHVDRMIESTQYYKQKRNADAGKINKDIFLGKKAEYIALFGLVKQYKFPFILPDLDIRSGKNKGWDDDLPFNKKDKTFPNVTVKSCNKATLNYCDDFSWTFQYCNNDGVGGKDKMFSNYSESLVAFVFMENPLSANGVIKAILPFTSIVHYFKPPLNPKLIGLKKCIYYKDLLLNKDKLER